MLSLDIDEKITKLLEFVSIEEINETLNSISEVYILHSPNDRLDIANKICTVNKLTSFFSTL